MSAPLAHRGPDGEGVEAGSGWGLGHRRLAVIDVEGGRQPMANEDESVWVVFNGEIYNHRALRRKLEARGHAFRTRCDTEVLVHLYEERGTDLVEDLEGMFAFAIWDERRRRLLLARDRVGEKPLYFYFDGTRFAFASEVKALLALPWFEREIRPEAIDEYLTYQFVPGPGTIWKNVERVQPGERLVVVPGEAPRRERYFSFDLREKTNLSPAAARESFRRLLLDAVAERMEADVPLGAFLSGGIDSSSVVWAMTEAVRAGRAAGPVRTFSIGFPEADFTETEHAEAVARRFGTEHETFVVEPKHVDDLARIVWHYDQPYADSSALPSFALCEAVRSRVTVALTGDGGDELFGGYDRYRAVRIGRTIRAAIPHAVFAAFARAARHIPEGSGRRSLPRRLRRSLEALRGGPSELNLALFRYFSEAEKDRIYAPDFAASLARRDAERILLDRIERAPAGDVLDGVLYADLTLYLPDDLLVKMDVAAMSVGLETRAPLLDTRILALSQSLPSTWKVGWRTGKVFFREAMRGILPDSILAREKMGFGVPISHWFRGSLYEHLRSRLLSKDVEDLGLFRRDGLAALIEEHRSGARNHANRLWALLALVTWYEVFKGRGL